MRSRLRRPQRPMRSSASTHRRRSAWCFATAPTDSPRRPDDRTNGAPRHHVWSLDCMRLVMFEHAGTNRTGVVVDGKVYDLAALSEGDAQGPLPSDMLGLLALGPSGLER